MERMTDTELTIDSLETDVQEKDDAIELMLEAVRDLKARMEKRVEVYAIARDNPLVTDNAARQYWIGKLGSLKIDLLQLDGTLKAMEKFAADAA